MTVAGCVLLGMAMIVAFAIGDETDPCDSDCACFPDEDTCDLTGKHAGKACQERVN